MSRISAKDWTLLAIALARGERMTPVQLQKSLFLLGRELPKEVGSEFYNFVPYDYGPFSSQVYDDAEDLALQGLVSLVRHPGADWRDFVATDMGTRRASEVQKRASPKALKYLASVVKWTMSLDFPDLVRKIYARYPEYKANSVFTE
jgi:uncharacterized protein